MSQIDWSKAPEDATHHGRGDDCCYWAKQVDGKQYFINIARWDNGNWKEVTERYDAEFLTERPKSEWTGEGLPPVGTVCEIKQSKDWTKVEVVAIHNDCAVIAIPCGGSFEYDQRDASELRPIRTPEQVAAEERRKSAIALYEAVMNFGKLAFDRLPLDRQEHYLKLVDAGWQQVKS